MEFPVEAVIYSTLLVLHKGGNFGLIVINVFNSGYMYFKTIMCKAHSLSKY